MRGGSSSKQGKLVFDTFNRILTIHKSIKKIKHSGGIPLDKVHSFRESIVDWLVSVLPVRQIKNGIARDRAVVGFGRVVKLRTLAHFLNHERGRSWVTKASPLTVWSYICVCICPSVRSRRASWLRLTVGWCRNAYAPSRTGVTVTKREGQFLEPAGDKCINTQHSKTETFTCRCGIFLKQSSLSTV